MIMIAMTILMIIKKGEIKRMILIKTTSMQSSLRCKLKSWKIRKDKKYQLCLNHLAQPLLLNKK